MNERLMDFGLARNFEFEAMVTVPDMWHGEPCQSLHKLIVEALNQKFPTDSLTPASMQQRLGNALLHFDAGIDEAVPNHPTIDVQPILTRFFSGPRLVLSDGNRTAFHIAVLVMNILPYEDLSVPEHFVPYDFVLEEIMHFLALENWVARFTSVDVKKGRKAHLVLTDTCALIGTHPLVVTRDLELRPIFCCAVSSDFGNGYPRNVAVAGLQHDRLKKWSVVVNTIVFFSIHDQRHWNSDVSFQPWHMSFSACGQWFFADDLDSTDRSSLIVHYMVMMIDHGKTCWITTIPRNELSGISRDEECRRLFTAFVLQAPEAPWMEELD